MIKRVIYNESQQQFFQDVLTNRFIDKMEQMSRDMNIYPSKQELVSWNNNAPKIKNLLELSKVNDTYVTFEYMIPFNRKRIDCMIYGKGINKESNVVHIELKQWTNDSVKRSKSKGNFNVEENKNNDEYLMEAFVAGDFRILPHPSQQVEGYNNYLINFVDVLSKHELEIEGMAYCYNYRRHSNGTKVLYDSQYDKIQEKYRTYSGDEIIELANRLHNILCNGDGFSIFNKMMQSPIKPSKKLLESASQMIHEGKENVFSLIEDQIIARNIILDKIDRNQKLEKSVVIVKGGPGTGKTVIALNVLATLAKKEYKIHFATKSKPLLEGIKDRLPKGSNTKLLFSNVHQFLPCAMEENQLDVLLIDEAHRISKNANLQYDKKEQRTDLSQIETIIRASKITVFFIDDKQAVRSQEIGNSAYIKECAIKFNANFEEVELKSQFRCNGSDNYLDWLEQILYNEDIIKASFTKEEYDFKIFDSPKDLYNAILEKNSKEDTTARLTAGFCWPWSKTLDSNGNLQKDVKIGNFAMPWETNDKITKIPNGYVKWYEWAYKPEGIKQIGCIYTAQGFEFDYVGVIIGEDLKLSEDGKKIETDISKTKDPTLMRGRQNFDNYVRNIYRVLMSRGMKGCYVYFCDQRLKKYFEQKLKNMTTM